MLTGVLRDFPAGTSVSPLVGQPFSSDCGGCQLLPDHHSIYGASAQVQQLWNDVPGINQRALHSITLTNAGQMDPDVLVFEDAAFYPADGRMFGNEGRAHNEEFSYELATTIVYEPGMRLRVTTPDTAFVYIEELHTSWATAADGWIDMDRFASERRVVAGRALSLQIFYTHAAGTVPRLGIQLAGPPICSVRAQGTLEAIGTNGRDGSSQAAAGADPMLRAAPRSWRAARLRPRSRRAPS